MRLFGELAGPRSHRFPARSLITTSSRWWISKSGSPICVERSVDREVRTTAGQEAGVTCYKNKSKSNRRSFDCAALRSG